MKNFKWKNKQTNAKWRELGERKYHTTPISTANIDCALYKLGLLYNETSCISLQIPISIDRAIKLTIRILSTNATISVTMKIRNQQSQFFPFNFRQKFKVNLASYGVIRSTSGRIIVPGQWQRKSTHSMLSILLLHLIPHSFLCEFSWCDRFPENSPLNWPLLAFHCN